MIPGVPSGRAGARPAAIILAAGASSRMGRVKALLEFEGETFLGRLVRVLGERCSPVIVVLGYHAEEIERGTQQTDAVRFVTNPDPDRGMLSSLKAGLAAAPLENGLLFTPVDTPAVSAETIDRVAEALAQGAAVAVPVYQSKRGHPVAISQRVAERLLALSDNERANDAIRKEAAVEIPVDDSGVVLEVDTPEDYQELLCRAG